MQRLQRPVRLGRRRQHSAFWANAGGDRSVTARGKNDGQAGEIADLLHRSITVWQLEQVEVRVRHNGVLGLATCPVTHVLIA